MLFTLHEFADDLNISVHSIDVDSNKELQQQYNELVPVLNIGTRQICHHFFDRQALIQALDAERAVN